MSYRTQSNYTQQSVTPIDLLDLEDLDGPSGMQPVETEKYTKNIRHTHQLPPESGMSDMNGQQQHFNEPEYGQGYEKIPFPAPEPVNELTTYRMPHNSPSCLEVAEHIANCPICSKFYNNDKTIYIIVIVILAIICILLLKRVLEI